MSSICRKKTGIYYVQFSPGEIPARAGRTRRPKISLGKITKKQAQMAQTYLESLCRARLTGTSMPVATTQWVENVSVQIRERLEELGLVEIRDAAGYSLKKWIDRYISKRPDVKASTLITYGNAKRNLTDFFGANKLLSKITAQDARDFKGWLLSNQGLSENTARKRCSISKQFFTAAQRSRIINENPFEGIPCSVRENTSRFYFVSPEESQQVLKACPDIQWRIIFSLCRWGGLRCPSEVLRLKWEDILWAEQKLVVHSSKTENSANGGVRMVPLFAELYKPLLRLYDQAEVGDSHVVTRYREGQNLGTLLRKIVIKAGIKPWPKICQNLRSTRETELFKLTGGNIKAVCEWIGNSPAVAMKHYAQVTQLDFDDVLEAAAKLNDSVELQRAASA